MICPACKQEPAGCWCPCPLCGKSSTAKPGTPEACACPYEDIVNALRISGDYAGACRSAGFELTAALAQMEPWSEDDISTEYLNRERVMQLVMDWRRKVDAASVGTHRGRVPPKLPGTADPE